MQFDGVLPQDAPDPRLRITEQLQAMPVPILGLVPQPHIEDWGAFGISADTSRGAVDQMTVSLGYTLWRNPDDRSDPVNLAELDDETRRALDMRTPWPRPTWLLETAARMRYPMLWEAVRTTWRRDAPHRPSPAAELAHHVDDILRNRPSARSAPDADTRRKRPACFVDAHLVEYGEPVVVNGAVVAGMRLDADPHVLGIGADLGEAGVLTAVFDRDALPYLLVEFATRPLDL